MVAHVEIVIIVGDADADNAVGIVAVVVGVVVALAVVVDTVSTQFTLKDVQSNIGDFELLLGLLDDVAFSLELDLMIYLCGSSSFAVQLPGGFAKENHTSLSHPSQVHLGISEIFSSAPRS